MIIIIGIVYVLCGVAFIYREYKKHFITPILVFSIMQMVMFIGIIMISNPDSHSDVMLLFLYLVALIGIWVGSFFNSKYQNNIVNIVDISKDITKSQFIKIVIWAGISIIICYCFFLGVGGNAFSIIINNGIETNIAEVRKEINYASGSGIVYQFRVFILPVLMITLVTSSNKKYRIYGIILAPISVLYLLGSGQRGGLVAVMIIYLIVFLYRNKHIKTAKKEIKARLEYKGIKKSRKFAIIFLFCACVVFAVLTITNGRTEVSGSLINAIFDRIILDNQASAKYGFEYFVAGKCVFGYDWLMMTLELIPGISTGYVSVASRVFKMKYGSLMGTSPLCIWGSTYYNFGVIGVFLIAFLIGLSYSYIGKNISKKQLSTVGLVLYAELIVVLGTWICDGPYYLINNGGAATLLLFMVLIKSPIKLSFGGKK